MIYEKFEIKDDKRRLYGEELDLEYNKYRHAILDVWFSEDAIGDFEFFDDTYDCILKEVLDFGNPKKQSYEGIEKGELHRIRSIRFARGVRKAFDKKLIDEEVCRKLIDNLRGNLRKNYLSKSYRTDFFLHQFQKSLLKGGKSSSELPIRGIELRSRKIL